MYHYNGVSTSEEIIKKIYFIWKIVVERIAKKETYTIGRLYLVG